MAFRLAACSTLNLPRLLCVPNVAAPALHSAPLGINPSRTLSFKRPNLTDLKTRGRYCPWTGSGLQASAPAARVSSSIVCAATGTKESTPAQNAEEEEEEGEDDAPCSAVLIDFDNVADVKYTIINIQSGDAPGLLHSIAWCLTGLEMRLENAILKTDKDGMVTDTLWLTDRNGNKLSDVDAKAVCGRLADTITACVPEIEPVADVLVKTNLILDNLEDPEVTVLYVHLKNRADTPSQSLLNVAAAVQGAGVNIRKAIVQSCWDCLLPESVMVDFPEFEPQKSQVIKFWLTDARKNKLEYAAATGRHLWPVGVLVFCRH
eukprot:jgi/Mesvir1/18919/Mv18906-RA.1